MSLARDAPDETNTKRRPPRRATRLRLLFVLRHRPRGAPPSGAPPPGGPPPGPPRAPASTEDTLLFSLEGEPRLCMCTKGGKHHFVVGLSLSLSLTHRAAPPAGADNRGKYAPRIFADSRALSLSLSRAECLFSSLAGLGAHRRPARRRRWECGRLCDRRRDPRSRGSLSWGARKARREPKKNEREKSRPAREKRAREDLRGKQHRVLGLRRQPGPRPFGGSRAAASDRRDRFGIPLNFKTWSRRVTIESSNESRVSCGSSEHSRSSESGTIRPRYTSQERNTQIDATSAWRKAL